MYRKVHVRKNEETVSDKMFPPTNENNVIEYERYNNARIKIYSTLKTFTSSGTLFSAVFFSVKIGRNFSRGENSRGNSKRFENSEIVANEAWLKRYVGGVPAFPLCFRIYEQGGLFPSIERVAPRERENGNIGTGGRKWENDSNLVENGGGYRER